jgi:uncharacterized protein DUF559
MADNMLTIRAMAFAKNGSDHNYRVLRFWNNDVLSNMTGVLEVIEAALFTPTPPHPDHTGIASMIRPLPARGER